MGKASVIKVSHHPSRCNQRSSVGPWYRDGVATHLRSLELPIEGVDRDLIERHVDRVIIEAQAVEVRLTPSDAKELPELHRDELDASGPTSTPLVPPWKAPASVAVNDIVHSPTAVPPMAPEAREGLLSAIAKARGWIEELRLGCVATLAEIAECEGFGERHVRVLGPLAFVAPRVIAATADGSVAGYATVTGLPQRLPDPWAEQERRQKV